MVDVGSDVGGYRLVRRLGEGGFGVVFLGEHHDGHRGAVKVLHLRHTGDTDFRERFAREVALARQVSSFCTAQVLDADPDAVRPWIATEYVDGPTLADVVATEGPRAGGELYRLAVSTATALAAIHAVGVVHRDFKPENILLAGDGARVIDFGVSRALDGGRMSASTTIGTPRYMAPEQLQGLAVTPAIDVFAWGAVIAFAATGRDCFDGPNQGAVLLRVLMEEPDVAGVPESLLPLLRRCMDKDPQRRPTAKEVLATLLGYAEAEAEEVGDAGGALAAGERVATGRVAAPSAFAAAPVRGRRPFRFAGERYTNVEDVARALQDHWGQAVELLESAPHRYAMIRWLPPRSPAREVLLETPGPGRAALAVARLVAVLAPGSPPRYGGRELTLEALADGEGNPAAALVEDDELRKLVEVGLLVPFGAHHCRTPAEHDGCAEGAACERYARFARNLTALLVSAERYREWSRGISRMVNDDRLRYEPAFAELFAMAYRTLEEEPDADPERLAELAQGGLDEALTGHAPVEAPWMGEFTAGAEQVRAALRQSVYAAAPQDRWGVAASARLLGPVLREAVALRVDLERFVEQRRRERALREEAAARRREGARERAFALVGRENGLVDRNGAVWVLLAVVGIVCAIVFFEFDQGVLGGLLLLVAGVSVVLGLAAENGVLGGVRGLWGLERQEEPGVGRPIGKPEFVRRFAGNALRAEPEVERLRERLAALAPEGGEGTGGVREPRAPAAPGETAGPGREAAG